MHPPRGPPCSQPCLESHAPKDGPLSALPLASLSVSAHGDATFHFFFKLVTVYSLNARHRAKDWGNKRNKTNKVAAFIELMPSHKAFHNLGFVDYKVYLIIKENIC